MDEVNVREIPARGLFALECRVRAGEFDAVGNAFLWRLRDGGVPRPDGVAGAPFVVFHGDFDDEDGRIEWCWPVRADHAAEAAARLPDLTPRTEDAHHEAFAAAETAHVGVARIAAFTEALLAWADDRQRAPAGAVRQVLAPHPAAPGARLGCDWALPLR